MRDILFKTDDGIFSYRVAGVLIHQGKVLLHHPLHDPGYAFPGGHVSFGETSTQALVREFQEETGLAITPERLLWVGENFFPWGEKDCHQVCFYYKVALQDENQDIPQQNFWGMDELAQQRFQFQFSWVDLDDLDGILLYPIHVKDQLRHLSDQIEAFVYFDTPHKDPL